MTDEEVLPRELPILVGAGDGEPEWLILADRPEGGQVRTREWRGDRWHAEGVEHQRPSHALLELLERAAAKGRRLNQELYRIRLWLTGGGAGTR